MDISQMRRMDFYLGVPLTFLCGLLVKTKRLIMPVKQGVPDKVRSILLIELSEMGSMIQLVPLMDRLKKTYPEARLHFVTFKSSSHILHVSA